MDLLRVKFGSDPEFFFKKKGRVLEATKLVKEGKRYELIGKENDWELKGSTLISDGIQGELNTYSDYCRARQGNNFRNSFKTLRKFMNEKKVTITFEECVNVPKKQFSKMPNSCKEFGCEPSYNAYITKMDNVSVINVNPQEYSFRSAGGHIHLGLENTGRKINWWKTKKKQRELVKVLDVVLGNACVILDRHKGIVERRKNYGKAGEYRVKSYGIEYRTLSNFWLKDYKLMSMVFQLAKLSASIVEKEKGAELLSLVEEKNVVKAINKNRLGLAKQNFEAIKGFMGKNFEFSTSCYNKGLAETFYKLMKSKKTMFTALGIEGLTDKQLITRWCGNGDGHGRGFEAFLIKNGGRQRYPWD